MPDAFYERVREAAAAQHTSLTSFIEEALRVRLERPSEPDAPPFVVVAFEGTGVVPGVDLADSASLLEIMGG